jgi:hypothetical protein
MRNFKPHLKYASTISTSGKDCHTGSVLVGYELASKAENHRLYPGSKIGIKFFREVRSSYSRVDILSS